MEFECQNLFKEFPTRNGFVSVLDDLSFQVSEGEFVCLVGPSGCGKTTLLKIIAGLLAPTGGAIGFKQPKPDLSPRAAMVFQEHGIFPWMTVAENVAFGLEMQGFSKAIRIGRALEFIEKIGLGPFSNSYPHELSVGMRQRVAIARALLVESRILLMDEPFGSLDAQTRMVLQEELLAHWRRYKKTVLFVTHDVEEAVLLGDRVLVMTGRPSRLCREIDVPLLRPRNLRTGDQKSATAIKWQIWKLLEVEVRKSLSMRAKE